MARSTLAQHSVDGGGGEGEGGGGEGEGGGCDGEGGGSKGLGGGGDRDRGERRLADAGAEVGAVASASDLLLTITLKPLCAHPPIV